MRALRQFKAVLFLLAALLAGAGRAESSGLRPADELVLVDKLLAEVDPADGTVHVGDMRITVKQLEEHKANLRTAQNGGRSAFEKLFKKWPESVRNDKSSSYVPYRLDASLSDTQRANFLKACRNWEAVANVTFIERATEADYINVRDDNTGNHSNVGKIGGAQNLSLDSSAEYTIVHELGHALGQIHEQSRVDRDQFVTILSDNIRDGESHNFRLVPGGLALGPYDFDSIMHYSTTAFAKTAGLKTFELKVPYAGTVGQRSRLSELDKVGMRSIYPFKTLAFESQPAATPSSAFAGQTVAFNASVKSAEPVAYKWNFGDGASGSGASVGHIFSAAGSYRISLVATTAEPASAYQTFTLFVDPTLSVSRLTNNTNRGTVTVTGTIHVPAKFVVEGPATVDVGGVKQSFTLSKNGSGRTGKDNLKVTVKLTKKEALEQDAKFKLVINGAPDTITEESQVTVTINGVIFAN